MGWTFVQELIGMYWANRKSHHQSLSLVTAWNCKPKRGRNMAWTYLSLAVSGVIERPVFTWHSPSKQVKMVSTCLQHGRACTGYKLAPTCPPPPQKTSFSILFHLPPMLADGGYQAQAFKYLCICWLRSAIVPSPATPGQRLRMPQRHRSGAAGCTKPCWTAQWPVSLVHWWS